MLSKLDLNKIDIGIFSNIKDIMLGKHRVLTVKETWRIHIKYDQDDRINNFLKNYIWFIKLSLFNSFSNNNIEDFINVK